MEITRKTKSLPLWLKILVSILMLSVLFYQIDWPKYLSYLSDISLASITLAIAAYQISKLALSWRLYLLAKQVSIPTSFWDCMKLTYRSSLFALILPGSMGGDGYRWLRLKRYPGINHRSIFQLLLFDRCSGFVAMLAMLLICFSISNLFSSELSGLLRHVFTSLCLFIIYGIYWFLSRRFFPKFHSAIRKIEVSSYAVQIGQALVIMVLATNYWDIQHNISGLISLFLLSSFASLLPLSFGGIGSREIVFFYGAELIHLPQEAGVILGSLFYIINVASALPGLIMKEPRPA
ncbi:MAG: lysylphosphatidylglycerol synthase transmembrane domain-containing protein [Oligoflexus sp.]